MRVAIVGPFHPYKGGVAQHTTTLAHRLSERGHAVELIGWRRQYPRLLYPGQLTVDEPEVAPFPHSRARMSWHHPGSWWREARYLGNVDATVFVHVTPVQAVAYAPMARAARRRGVATVVLCHNVAPHESRRWDRRMTSWLLRQADRVIVHSDAEATVAHDLASSRVSVACLPPHFPDAFKPRSPRAGVHRRLLFVGFVRPYKGVDVLLEAMARSPEPFQLRIAGEFWQGTGALASLADRLGVSDRIELIDRYVAAEEVPSLFEDVDGLVLPYRSATGSQAVWLGFQMGVPVIATRVGPFASHVRDHVDGLLAEPGDVESLARALTTFYDPADTPLALRAAVSPPDADAAWSSYLDVLEAALAPLGSMTS